MIGKNEAKGRNDFSNVTEQVSIATTNVIAQPLNIKELFAILDIAFCINSKCFILDSSIVFAYFAYHNIKIDNSKH